VNGKLREGDTVVLATSDGGAVVTQIRSLLMPQPMKELRVKVIVVIRCSLFLTKTGLAGSLKEA